MVSYTTFVFVFLLMGWNAVSQTSGRSLPSFATLRRNYPGYNDYTSDEIKKEIGGNVNAGYIDNTCAVRMSRALNKIAGHRITRPLYDRTERRYDSVRGADGYQYIFRVTGLGRYLTNTYFSPIYSTSISAFYGKKGIMRLNLSGSSSYTGHFALWDGYGFYQSADYSGRATGMYLWETS